MKLEEILDLWGNDSSIDNTELDKESLKIPSLHNKYLKIYAAENLDLKRQLHNFKEMERNKFEYYSGKMDEEDLVEQLETYEEFYNLLVSNDIANIPSKIEGTEQNEQTINTAEEADQPKAKKVEANEI